MNYSYIIVLSCFLYGALKASEIENVTIAISSLKDLNDDDLNVKSVPMCKEMRVEEPGEPKSGIRMRAFVDECRVVCHHIALFPDDISTLNRYIISRKAYFTIRVDDLNVFYRHYDDRKITNHALNGVPLGFETSGQSYLNNVFHLDFLYYSSKNGTKKRIDQVIVSHRSATRDSFMMINETSICSLQPILNHQKLSYTLIRQPGENIISWIFTTSWTKIDTDEGIRLLDLPLDHKDVINAVVHQDESHDWLLRIISPNLLLWSIFFLNKIFLVLLYFNIMNEIRRSHHRSNDSPFSSYVISQTSLSDRILASDGDADFGWKIVRFDVFRSPSYARFFCILLTTGAHVLFTTLIALFISTLFYLNISQSFKLFVTLYILLAPCTGFYFGRLLMTLYGEAGWKLLSIILSGFYPLLIMICLNQSIADFASANVSTPTTINNMPLVSTYLMFLSQKYILMLVLVFMGVNVPLVLIGCYFGVRKGPFRLPLRVNRIPSAVPRQPIYGQLHFSMVICISISYLLLVALQRRALVDLTHNSKDSGTGLHFGSFGRLIDLLITTITSSEFSILFMYVQLNLENHHWWWRAYFNGSSMGLVMLLDHLFHVLNYDISSVTFKLGGGIFSLILAVSISVSVCCGFVSVASCYYVCKLLYSSIKLD